jgi:glucokinase
MRILAIDIGGTKTAVALCTTSSTAEPHLDHFETFKSQEFNSLEEVIARWQSIHPQQMFDAIGAGVAGPVVDDHVHLTNLGWNIRAGEVRQTTGKPFKICNDMTAHAWGVLSLSNQSLIALNIGKEGVGNKALIAAGTGLGESIMPFDGTRHYPLAGEGGHASFSPTSEQELRLLSFLQRRNQGHVSWERILGGHDGFRNLTEFLAEEQCIPLPSYIPEGQADWGAVISQAAEGHDPFAKDVLDFYCELYGREAGNLALKCIPFGGLYIAGGIAPKILTWLQRRFMKGFLDKGRFTDILRGIPVYVVNDPFTGLKGAAIQLIS